MAAADLNAIRATLELHLIAGFGANINTQDDNILTGQDGIIILTESPEADPTPIAFRNTAYKPISSDSFVQCLVTFGSAPYLTLGSTTNSYNQINGSIEANIFTPQGVGPGANYDLASRVCNLYTREILDGIQVGPPSGPSVVTASQPPAFFQSTVTVPFNFIEEL